MAKTGADSSLAAAAAAFDVPSTASLGYDSSSNASVYREGRAPALVIVRVSDDASPETTPPKSRAGAERESTTFFVVHRTGTSIGPVAHVNGSVTSMSWLSFGVNVSVSTHDVPADIRPGGACVRTKKSRTFSGSSPGRNELNEYEMFVSVNLSV